MNPEEEINQLKGRLAEAARREGEFRLKSAQDFLAAEDRLRAQAQDIAERDVKVDQLNRSAIERDRYIHQLHLEQIELRNALQSIHADLETFTWMLQEAESEHVRPPLSPDEPGARFTYHLHTSPYRIYRAGRFILRGWAFPADGRAVSAVRARVDDQAFPGRCGLPEPEVIARHGPQPQNPQPGFEIDFATPPGRHRLRIEACLENRDWVSILNLPIWCRREPNSEPQAKGPAHDPQ